MQLRQRRMQKRLGARLIVDTAPRQQAGGPAFEAGFLELRGGGRSGRREPFDRRAQSGYLSATAPRARNLW